MAAQTRRARGGPHPAASRPATPANRRARRPLPARRAPRLLRVPSIVRRWLPSGGVLPALGDSAKSQRLTRRALVALLTVAVSYRLLLLLRGWPSLDSDEAIIGLMARHIQTLGEHPLFFYGQYYLGPFQAYLAVPLFAIFGASILTLRTVVLVETLAFIGVMYWVGRAAYGRVVGLLVVPWLALGPPYAVMRELVAVGGHQEMLLIAAVLVLLAWMRLRQPDARPRTPREWRRCLAMYAVMGALAGLGVWADLLLVPVLVMVALALLLGRPREVFAAHGATLVCCFLLVTSPVILFNITYKNATFKQITRQSRPEGRQYSWPTLAEWQQQIGETLAVGLPVTLGSPHVCVTQGNIWGWYPPSAATAKPGVQPLCNDANIALSLGVAALYGITLWQALRVLWTWAPGARRRLSARARRLRTAATLLRTPRVALRVATAGHAPRTRSPAVAGASAQLWLRLILLGTALLTLAAYASSINAQRYQFTAARYLLPLYLTVPLLLGALWERAAPLAVRAAVWLARQINPATARLRRRPLPDGGITAVLAAATLLAIFTVSLWGAQQTTIYAGDTRAFGMPTTAVDRDLIAFLDAHAIHAYYSDYWTCYRIAFETNERIICAVRGQDDEPSLRLMNNRYAPYVDALAATTYPAYILPAGSAPDLQFASVAEAQGLPHTGYTRAQVGQYAVYYHT